VARVTISRIEIINGKLSTAISTLLLLALDDNPEMKVSDVENPTDASTSVVKKISLSSMGSKIRTEKRR
jgi:hypothetical protein